MFITTKNILMLLDQRNISANKLAIECELSNSAITEWKKGKSNPSTKALEKIAAFFDLPLSYFYSEHTNAETPLPPDAIPISGEFISLPVIGTITAGYDGTAQEEFTGEYLEIPREILARYSREELYVLTVKGDSMYPELLDGDKVLVYRVDSVDSGTVAVVLYNGDAATVKRVEYEQGKDYVDLIPRNPEYKTKHIEGADLEQCRILGKVIYLFRKF